jgi:hypothetical protein
MGYSTDFSGELTLSKPLTVSQFKYLEKFSGTRRMKRDVNKLMELYKGKGGYPGKTVKKNTPEEIYGKDGEYFVGGDGFAGQDRDASIIDFNTPPGQVGYNEKTEWEDRYLENNRRVNAGKCQPGLWCQWVVEGDKEQVLQWDGNEKFYSYIEWLKYLINHFFKPWGVKLNGEIDWYGEEKSDMGRISVKNNEVKVFEAVVTYKNKDGK